MNILFLSRLYSPHIGGVEKHLSGIAKELKSRHQITVITEKYADELKDQEIDEGINIYRIPLVGVGESEKKWIIWRWILKHQSLFNSADIIHVHDIMFWLYPYKLIHPWKKIFITFHGWEGRYPLPLKNVIQKRLDKFLSSRNICAGEYIGKWYGIKPDFITYGACSKPKMQNSSKPGSPKILLYLGRLDQDTGLTRCLDLYSRLKKSLDWQLVIAGDGPLKHLLPSSVKFLGFVPNPAVHIAKSDYVFCTGYLGILESWIQHKIVLSAYSNPLKQDYLFMHPMSKYLVFDEPLPDQLPEMAYNWAKAQTWAKLTQLYLQLWSK